MRRMQRLAVILPCALLLTLAARDGASQIQVPDIVKETIEASRSAATAPGKGLMLTNADYKVFNTGLKVEYKNETAPVMMTGREAGDYAAFAGKKLGVDLIWKKEPESEKGGYLYFAEKSPEMKVIKQPAWPPATPEGMTYVPEGPFIMGSDKGDLDETPKHADRTGAFCVDKYEVSNTEFKAAFPSFVFEPGKEECAAVVNWQQAADYAAKVGKRLPTEQEWEKAARGMDGRTFPWGESYDPTFTAWDENQPRGGSIAKPASPYGCFDMAGGVWEWTADWYKPYPGNDTPCDEYGETYKVIRGGASFNDIAMMRTTQRYYLPPNTTGHLRTGFRCVKSVE